MHLEFTTRNNKANIKVQSTLFPKMQSKLKSAIIFLILIQLNAPAYGKVESSISAVEAVAIEKVCYLFLFRFRLKLYR